MMTFVLFDADGVEPGRFPPRHAFQVGPDDIPVQGVVKVGSGLIECEKLVPQTSGVSLQFGVGKPELGDGTGSVWAGPRLPGGDGTLGVLTVQTCLLPERDRPYLLTIEVARHRIMGFLNKQEDWGLMDLPAEHGLMQQFERARQAFTEALVAQTGGLNGSPKVGPGAFSPAADRLAAKAVALAVDAGERLAVMQADRQIRSRLSGGLYAEASAHLARLTPETPPAGSPIVIPGAGYCVLNGRPQVGVAVSPGQCTEAMQKGALATADFVTMPMRWVDLEPVEGKYSFAATDRWIEWAIRTAKLPVVGGPLVDFRPESTPDFLFIWENDYETLRDLVQEHVSAVVTRYRRTVTRWTVASGLHVNTNFKISFEQIMDLTRMCVLLTKKLQPAAKIQLEISQPWGEYHATNRRSIPPYLYAEAVVQGGLPVDAVALRVQMGHAQPGCSTRDLMSLSSLLDRFGALERPVAVSSLGAPSAGIAPAPYCPRAGSAAGDPYEPGQWRAPWSEATQTEWMTLAMGICCSKPFVQSVCWQELSDPPAGVRAGEMPGGGLMHANGQPKAALLRLAQFRAALRDGKSPLDLAACKPERA